MENLLELKNYIKQNCIKRGDFTLKSGFKTNYYIDLGMLYKDLNAPSLDLSYFTDEINEPYSVFLAEGGAINLAHSFLSPFSSRIEKLDTYIVYPKEWPIYINKAYIIEDVATTGKTILDLIQLIPRYITDVTVLLFVDRSPNYKTLDKVRGKAKIITLFKIEDLLRE